jgi:G3E family GTPase
MIPVSIVTGFLGSGKTTLLNRLLRGPESRGTLVLVNEFGDIGIDHLLYEAVDQDIVLLESGCVCCSVRDDFAEALLRSVNHQRQGRLPDLRRAIIETTGIADPLQIVQILLNHPELRADFHPGTVIAVVDGVYGNRTLDGHIEAIQQAVLADRVFISKTDLAEAREIERLRERVRALNPGAATIISGASAQAAILLDADRHSTRKFDAGVRRCAGDADAGKSDRLSDSPRHDARFSTFTLSWTDPVDWEEFLAWLQGLLIARGDDVFRVKGLVHARGRQKPLILQAVQHSVYSPVELEAWPHGLACTELVFVTRDFNSRAAITSLKPFLSARAFGSISASR